jgi:hypothetical protein
MATEAAEVFPVVQVDEELLWLGAQPFAHCLDNSQICLMRTISLSVNFQFAPTQGFGGGGFHGLTALLKVSLPSAQIVQTRVNRLSGSRAALPPPP